MDLDLLRERLKEIKQKKQISYTYFAKEIGISNNGFYNFMSGAKGLSEEKQELLKESIKKFL